MTTGKDFAGKVECQRVKMGVKTTDMFLSGQHVANMLADMSATRHKKSVGKGTAGVGLTCHLLTCWPGVVVMSTESADMLLTCCRHVTSQSIELSN